VHYSWTAFWVNSQTPDNVTKVLADAMKKAMADPESQAFITKTDAEVMALGPDPTIGAYLQGVVVGFGLSLEGAG
jgi:tripartite-type tricarboxylate transporter receptor subunit TctC